MKRSALPLAPLSVAVLACLLEPASAAERVSNADATLADGGLTPLDWGIIALYAAGTILLGWRYSRKQSTTSEYFVGSGHMNPILIGVSLFATLLSTISYLSMPGEALGKGPVFATTMLGFPLVFLIVGYVLLPVYMRQRVTSAYELLEVKLGLSLRLLGAGMFVALRLVWMSLLVYLTAKAMTIMLGVGDDWIPLVALVTGLVAVVYTSLGGLRAVVVTDSIQTLLLLGGALLVIATVTWDRGGFGWFPTAWQPTWDTQPIISFDPGVRATLVGTILSFLVWYVATTGGDQVSVQRFMATENAVKARRALGVQLGVTVVIVATLMLVGFSLLGYFRAHPGELPAGADMKQNADDLFPHYIAFHLPAGISGLVVAGMFAAAMSSIDSGVNSITAVVLTDFLDRFGRAPKTEKGHLRFAQGLAFGVGTVVVVGSSFMEHVPGNITAVTQKTSNLLTVPIFGLFVFALFVPFATRAGVWIGTICGTLTAALIAFSGPWVALLAHWLGVDPTIDPAFLGTEIVVSVDPATGKETWTAADPISFQWIAPAALVVDVGVGCWASWLTAERRSQPDA